MVKKNFTIRHATARQQGNVVMLIIAGIAALSVLALIGSTLVSSLIGGTQRSNLNGMTSQILTQASYTLTTEVNTSGSYPVATAPAAWSGTTPSTAPLIGTANAVGKITATSAAPKVDAWGSTIAYCTYTAAAQGDPVFAVISAGPDKVFQTTCTQAFAGTPQGDDSVRWKTVANVVQGVGGTVYYGDPVNTVAALPTTNNKTGTVRIVNANGIAYIWNGTAWIAQVPSASITITAASDCTAYGSGALAHDSNGDLYICK